MNDQERQYAAAAPDDGSAKRRVPQESHGSDKRPVAPPLRSEAPYQPDPAGPTVIGGQTAPEQPAAPRKRRRWPIVLVLAVLIIASLFLLAGPVLNLLANMPSNYSYQVNPDGETCIIADYTPPFALPNGSVDLHIPGELEGLRVTEIDTSNLGGKGSQSFYRHDELRSVVIPQGVVRIGNNAFANCSYIVSVELPDALQEIGGLAFMNCGRLEAIEIPRGVTKIGGHAFDNCWSLTEVVIPDNVTEIGNNAFAGCSSLRSVSLPGGLKGVGVRLFSGCKSLTALTIPESVTYIDQEAFKGCEALTALTIPERVTYIGPDAFKGCEGISLHVSRDSAAHKYAMENNIPYRVK